MYLQCKQQPQVNWFAIYKIHHLINLLKITSPYPTGENFFYLILHFIYLLIQNFLTLDPTNNLNYVDSQG